MKQRQNTDETWAEILRGAIQSSGLTYYRLSKLSGIGETQIARFMSGKTGLHLDSAGKLGQAMGLELRHRKPGKSE